MSKVNIIVTYEYEIDPKNYSDELKTDLKRMNCDKINMKNEGFIFDEFATIKKEEWKLI